MHETDRRDERYRRFIGQDYCFYVSVARKAQADEIRRLLPIAAARLRAPCSARCARSHARATRPRTRRELTLR